jgi:hypothetical protein
MFVKPLASPQTAPAFSDGWSPPVRPPRTQMEVITTASTALLWVDHLSEHYCGGLLLDGALAAASGVIRLDDAGPGLGLQFRTQDAEAHRVA